MDMDILAISVFSFEVDFCPVGIIVLRTYAMHNCFIICVTDTTVSAFSFYSTKRFANFRIRFLSSKLNMYFSNCCVFSKLLHCSHTIVILCSISSKLMLRVIPLRSLLQQCRNILLTITI